MRFNEALEAERAEDCAGLLQRRAKPGRLLGRRLKQLPFVERAHHQAHGSTGSGKLGEALRLAGALVVPNIEWIERVDAPNFEPAILGLGADTASRVDVLNAVCAHVVAQFDRDGSGLNSRVDEFVGRQRRRHHMVEAELYLAVRHLRSLQLNLDRAAKTFALTRSDQSCVRLQS